MCVWGGGGGVGGGEEREGGGGSGESILTQNSFSKEILEKFDKFYTTKTYLYKFDPLKAHFYIVKLGFIGVYIIFHISA